MAQVIESQFICDGRYRIHSINTVGRHRARIIEIEDVDCCLRFYGPASKLDRLALRLLSQARRERWNSRKRGAT